MREQLQLRLELREDVMFFMSSGPTEKIGQRADAGRLATGPRRLWARPLAIATAVVFFISSAFPVVAGLSKNTAAFSIWWGRADVGLAFVLGMLALAVMAVGQGQVDRQAIDASYRAYRILHNGILVMLVVFFLAGDRIVWPNCLTGFAWRAWLLLYVLPEWFAALRTPAPS